jgi:hypothetical protein
MIIFISVGKQVYHLDCYKRNFIYVFLCSQFHSVEREENCCLLFTTLIQCQNYYCYPNTELFRRNALYLYLEDIQFKSLPGYEMNSGLIP